MVKDAEITERLERVEEIIDQLEVYECDRAEGEALYEEGYRLVGGSGTSQRPQRRPGIGAITRAKRHT